MNLSVVLVRSEQPGNVGAAARALANMGGDRLILIDPRCEVDAAAYALAAGADHVLDRTVTYPSWDAFYASEGEGLRIALTRRVGKQRKTFALKEKLAELAVPPHLYLIFGPERDGLAAEDMAWVNYACYLPAHGEMASLNLAQAVLLACYLARERAPATSRAGALDGHVPETAPFYFPDQLIKDWLEAMGFDVNARKKSAYLTLRRLFLQNLPTKHETRVLEAILRQNIRKLLRLPAEELRDDGTEVPGQ